MSLLGKVAVILLSFAAILWAAYVKGLSAAEAFFATDCTKFTDCKTCADVGGCVWCPGANKCSAQDRTGLPTDEACDKATAVLFSDRCGATEAAGTGRLGGSALPGSDCPSSAEVVQDALKLLDPTVKETVAKELKAYGLTMKEGFTGEVDLVLASIRDKTKELTRRAAMGGPE